MAHSKWTVEVVRRLGPVEASAGGKAKAHPKAKACAKSTASVNGEISSVMEAFRFVKSLRRFQHSNSFRLVKVGKR